MSENINDRSVMDDVQIGGRSGIAKSDHFLAAQAKTTRQGLIPEKIGDINDTIDRVMTSFEELVERIQPILGLDIPTETSDVLGLEEGSATLTKLREVDNRLSHFRARIMEISDRVEL